MKGNLGFIFATNCELDDIRDTLGKFVLESAAKSGQVSMVNVELPSGPTGMDPSQTSFFQTLNIATKIVKGQIELISSFAILRPGEKVSASAAVLLTKLGIRPFSYKMEVEMVFQNGGVFNAAVLDISDDILMSKFLNGVNNMAALGNAFKNVAALIGETAFTFKEVEEVKKFLADPDAYAAANPVAAAPAAGGGG